MFYCTIVCTNYNLKRVKINIRILGILRKILPKKYCNILYLKIKVSVADLYFTMKDLFVVKVINVTCHQGWHNTCYQSPTAYSGTSEILSNYRAGNSRNCVCRLAHLYYLQKFLSRKLHTIRRNYILLVLSYQ